VQEAAVGAVAVGISCNGHIRGLGHRDTHTLVPSVSTLALAATAPASAAAAPAAAAALRSAMLFSVALTPSVQTRSAERVVAPSD
jgi:hypothetical protein